MYSCLNVILYVCVCPLVAQLSFHCCLVQLESDLGVLPSACVRFCADLLAFPAVVASQLRVAQLTVSTAAETADRTEMPD